eukprot:m.56311 g.56311  ORF g.56311 m.56311 type:complete len:82 (+) comp48939_c0_seq22:1328-1573(+)
MTQAQIFHGMNSEDQLYHIYETISPNAKSIAKFCEECQLDPSRIPQPNVTDFQPLAPVRQNHFSPSRHPSIYLLRFLSIRL